MKCILYGIGSGRLRVERYLKNKHDIVGYSDSFAEYEQFENKKFYKPQELFNAECDCIIICIGNKKIRKDVISNLEEYKVNSEKIFDFYDVYLKMYIKKLDIPLKNIDRIMYKNNENYEGIILGISHAQVGINPQYLDKKFCNLAVNSQDLYYNLRTLEILCKDYRERIRDLKYVIIDMYNYTYFNYDVSLSKNAINYYNSSGFGDDDSHNYEKNKNFNKSIEEEIKHIDEKDKNLFKELFESDDIDINSDYKETGAFNISFDDFPLKEDRDKCITDEEIDEYKNTYKESSLEKNIFEKTVKENREIFSDIMRTLININPEIKIYLVLIPVHKVQIDLKSSINSILKKDFYDIIDRFKETYNFKFLDFYDCKEISSKDCYFYDSDHLNYDGATVFTKTLNSYIEY